MAHRKLSPEQATTVASDYRNGKTLSQLGTKYDVNLVTIRNTLLRLGEPLRPAGGTARAFSKAQRADIVARWQAGESRVAIATDYKTHYSLVSRVIQSAGATREKPRANWKGGRSVTSGKYVVVRLAGDSPFASMRNAGGYVLEHRLVLAQQLGRPLLPTETAHHINGIKHDNRPENLQLRTGKHGKHEAWQCLDCGSANIAAVPLKDTPYD